MAWTSLMRLRCSRDRRSHFRTIGLPTKSSGLCLLVCLWEYPLPWCTLSPRLPSASYHLDELLHMKRQSSSTKPLTNFRRLRSMKNKDILLSAEHPEADVKHIVRGIVRSGLKAVPPKQSVSLRIDADVLEWFKSKGAGYQTRINSVLRAFTEVAR